MACGTIAGEWVNTEQPAQSNASSKIQQPATVSDKDLEPPTKHQKRTFAPHKSKEIVKAKLSAIPTKTTSDTKHCVNVWQQWCEFRCKTYGEKIKN